MIGVHVIEIHVHRRYLAQRVPLCDVLRVRAVATPRRLDIEDGDAVGRLIETGVFVFDLQVALEAVLRPQHHVMGIVSEFRTGRQGHALPAVPHGAHFAVEKPLFFPILRARIGEPFRPRGALGGLFERGLVRSGIGFRLIRRRMGGEQEAGDEGGKTAYPSRSGHGSLVGLVVCGIQRATGVAVFFFRS